MAQPDEDFTPDELAEAARRLTPEELALVAAIPAEKQRQALAEVPRKTDSPCPDGRTAKNARTFSAELPTAFTAARNSDAVQLSDLHQSRTSCSCSSAISFRS
jgi:hypothetical protein